MITDKKIDNLVEAFADLIERANRGYGVGVSVREELKKAIKDLFKND